LAIYEFIAIIEKSIQISSSPFCFSKRAHGILLFLFESMAQKIDASFEEIRVHASRIAFEWKRAFWVKKRFLIRIGAFHHYSLS